MPTHSKTQKFPQAILRYAIGTPSRITATTYVGKFGIVNIEKDLVLNDEVIKTVKDGMFHIYPVTHINEGIELLMRYPAGKKNEQGEFPENTVHGRVYKKLKAFSGASMDTYNDTRYQK